MADFLTTWQDLAAVGGIALLIATVAGRGKDLIQIYTWVKSALQSWQRHRLIHRVFFNEERLWREYEIQGLARWQTGQMPDGSFGAVRATSELCRMVGLAENEVLDEGWKSTVHPKYSGVISAWDNAMKNETNFSYRWAFRHRDGKIVYVHGEFHRIVIKGYFLGGLGGLIEITKDEVEDATDA